MGIRAFRPFAFSFPLQPFGSMAGEDIYLAALYHKKLKLWRLWFRNWPHPVRNVFNLCIVHVGQRQSIII